MRFRLDRCTKWSTRELVRALGSPEAEVSACAETEAAARVSAGDFDPADLVARAYGTFAGNTRVVGVCCGVLLGGAVASVFYWSGAGVLMASAFVMGLAIDRFRPSSRRRSRAAARIIGRLDDPAFVPALIRGSGVADAQMRQAITCALVRLLPGVDDQAQLGEDDRARLVGLLGDRDVDLVLSALGALEVVGGARQVGAIGWAVRGRGINWHVRRDLRVRQAALCALGAIEGRIAGSMAARDSRSYEVSDEDVQSVLAGLAGDDGDRLRTLEATWGAGGGRCADPWARAEGELAVSEFMDGITSPLAVPGLLKARDMGTASFVSAIDGALRRLLPVLPTDMAVAPAMRVSLALLLTHRDVDLVLAAVNALERFGNMGQADALTALAMGRDRRYPVGADPHVREAALRALEAIGERSGRTETRSLLRSAAVEDDTLVRPACGADGDVTQLLRPRSGE